MKPGVKAAVLVTALPVLWLAYLGLLGVLNDHGYLKQAMAPLPSQTIPYDTHVLKKVFKFPNGKICAYGVYIVEKAERKDGVRPWYDSVECQTFTWPLYGKGENSGWTDIESRAAQLAVAGEAYRQKRCGEIARDHKPLDVPCVELTPDFNLYREIVSLAAADPVHMADDAAKGKNYRLLAIRGVAKGYHSSGYSDATNGVYCNKDDTPETVVFDTRGMFDSGYEWEIFSHLLRMFVEEYNQEMIKQEGFPYACENFCTWYNCGH